MRKFQIHVDKKTWAAAVLVFLALSCRSNYVSLDYTLHHGACWNNAHTCIAFVASKKAYLNATGLSRFPDGGIPDYLVEEMGLYIYKPKDQHLTRIVDFSDLSSWLSSSRSHWKTTLVFKTPYLYYSISPVTPWDFYLKRAKTPAVRVMISTLKKKYDKSYSVNINTGIIKKIDSDLLHATYRQSREANKINLSALNKDLANIPLTQWGFALQDIYPKPEEAYIEETIFLLNTSTETRRAVVEQIISKKSNAQIQAILTKMDAYKKSLTGLEKKEYEMYSEATYNRIKNLL